MSTNLTDTLLNWNVRFIGVKSQKGIFLVISSNIFAFYKKRKRFLGKKIKYMAKSHKAREK